MAAPTPESLIDVTQALSRFLLAAREDEDKARQAYAQTKDIETRSRLRSAASRTRKLSADYDKGVRHAFAEEVFRVRIKA